MLRKLALAFFACTLSHIAFASDAMRTFNIVLLQPDSVLQKRIPDVSALSAYIKAIETSVESVLQAELEHIPAGGFLVVAVKPGEKSNVWLDFGPFLIPRTAEKILAAAKGVPPLSVQDGMVAFAIKVGFWGGSEPAAMAPSPAAWKAAAKKAGHPLELDALVETVWPE